MREVVLSITCDHCDKPIDEDYANSLEIKLSPSGSMWEMDLHDHCVDQVLAAARMMKPARKQNSATEPCKYCDFLAKTPSGLSLHIKRKHNGEETTNE